jgi:calcium-dependent protein kinase
VSAFEKYGEEQGEVDQEMINQVIKNVDLNNTEIIGYTEWLIATSDRDKILSKELLSSAFHYFSADGETITNEDLADAFETDKRSIDEYTWLEILE